MDVWQLRSPADCPVPSSDEFAGIAFTERYVSYTHADTWYPTWGDDGHLYSPYTDGKVTDDAPVWSFAGEPPFDIASVSARMQWDHGDNSSDETAELVGDEPPAQTGQARIVGDDPLALEIEDLGATAGDPDPYGGRYPCGSLVHDGVWYYGTYCLDAKQYNWDTLGPFVGFRVSTDDGETWEASPHTPADPIFGESGKDGQKVKMGAPKVVDFGQNLEHSPDGKAYLVGNGATRPNANLSWSTGDQVYLARASPGIDTMNNPDAYEFFAGHEDNEPVWSDYFAEIEPLFEWRGHCGPVTITYNASLRKYLMPISHGWPGEETMDTYILEADTITGPWSLVHYMEKFGEQGYFVNVPSKFIEDDGLTAWLCYSHNWNLKHKVNPPGGSYGMCLSEFKILR